MKRTVVAAGLEILRSRKILIRIQCSVKKIFTSLTSNKLKRKRTWMPITKSKNLYCKIPWVQLFWNVKKEDFHTVYLRQLMKMWNSWNLTSVDVHQQLSFLIHHTCKSCTHKNIMKQLRLMRGEVTSSTCSWHSSILIELTFIMP